MVVTDPIVKEAPNNDTMKTAQEVTLPATLCGTFEKGEDVTLTLGAEAVGHFFAFFGEGIVEIFDAFLEFFLICVVGFTGRRLGI